MDMLLIGAALTGINNLLNVAKNVEDQRVLAAINGAVAEIQSKLIQTQQQILEDQQERAELLRTIDSLRHKLEQRGKLIPHENVYWLDTEAYLDGPFCTLCQDVNSLLVRLTRTEREPRGWQNRPGYTIAFQCQVHDVTNRLTCTEDGTPIPPTSKSSVEGTQIAVKGSSAPPAN